MKIVTSLLFFSFVSCIHLLGQDLHNLQHEVDKIIEFEYDLQLEDKEGLWIGVIDGDSTFVFKIGNIEEDSLAEFQLGSVSKIFTYKILQQQLIEQGISEQTMITELISLQEHYNNISLQDLSNHKSNLPKDPYYFGKRSTNPGNPYENYPNELIVPELNKYSDLYTADKDPSFNYGHLNYALLGLVTESITDKTYCDQIEEEFSANYPSIKCSDTSNNLILGFDKSGYPALPWTFPGFESSEGLSANILDLTKFIKAELQEKQSENESIKVSKQLSFQAPWYILKLKRSQKIHSFSGTTGTHSVFVCFDKNTETAVVMMRNSGKGILHLPLSILEMVKSSKAQSK